MKKQIRGFLVLIALLSLSACGLKGPLYHPPADETSKPATQNVADSQQKAVSQPEESRTQN